MQSQRFVNRTVKVLAVADVDVGPVALSERAEFIADLLDLFGLLGEVVEEKGQRGGRGVATGHDDKAAVRAEQRIVGRFGGRVPALEEPAGDIWVHVVSAC